MKKLIALFLVLLLIAIGCVYFFIPGNLVVNNVVALQCSLSGANRVMIQKENWKKFWPGDVHLTQEASFVHTDFFTCDNDTFHILKFLQNAVSISIAGDKTNVTSTLQILPLLKDSIVLNWGYTLTASTNPFTRIQQYRQAVRVKTNMATALNSIKKYLSSNENIYGLTIIRTSTVDTFLISTKTILDSYPTTDQIYSLLTKLQAYSKENGAVQTGYPMLNVTQPDLQHFIVMTALPVNKILPEKEDITNKRMIKGSFLTATVTGGNGTVNNAYQQMGQYFQDYNRTSMAIPFSYLITDRSKETDTSKWITKIYFPVM